MKLSEKILEYRTARELFPKCVVCGRDLSALPLFSLRLAADRPNRFTCPDPCESGSPVLQRGRET